MGFLSPLVLLLLSAATTAAPADSVRFLGRVNPATKELTWPGTGVAFSFDGASASISVRTTGDNSVNLVIDGGEPIVIANVSGSAITTPAGLSKGRHTVEVRKRSEASFGSIFVGKVSVASGALLPAESTTVAGHSRRSRQIEIIGDSITVGYGLDGVGPSCVNTAAVEDNPRTYAALAAEALDAEYSVVAWSGRGIIRNYMFPVGDTSPIMPELYTRYGANDADGSYKPPSSWQPDAVVINLGTNDFGYVSYYANGTEYDVRPPLSATAYTAAIVQFARNITAKYYPRTQFFLLSSPMLSDSYPSAEDAQHTTQSKALQAAVKQLGSRYAHFVDWPSQGSEVGCDYHPNAATHAAEGKVLASAIAGVLGW